MASTISNTSAIGTAILSSPGLGSGLDVNTIVSKLMTVEQAPIQLLNTKEASYQSQITAWGTVQSALSTFQTAVEGLNDPTKFQTTTSSVVDTNIASASASATAVPGSYSLSVTQLAQAQKVYSGGFADPNTTVGNGTITFQFGSYDGTTFTPNTQKTAQTVTIGANQSSLASVRDAINAANVGVTATIVNDGSTKGNRLVFTATNGGASSSLKISVADADGNNTDTTGLSQLAYDPTAAVGSGKNLTQAIAAQDAKFTVDGIAFSKSSNTVTDAIAGVSLNLLGQSVGGAATTVSVARDTATVSKNVTAFVTAYNALSKALTSVSSYDATTKSGGPLLGNTGINLIQSQIRSLIGGGRATGTNTGFASLSQVGIAFQRDGSLTVDSTKLSTALSTNFTQVAGLFASVGTPSDPQIQYVSAGKNAQAGTYAVSVAALATQGKLAGQSAAGLTITAGVNDQLGVTIDGTSTSVTLAAGTYATADALASQVQSAINGDGKLSAAGTSVSVSQTGGVLSVTSARYGSASTVAIGGTGAANLFGAAPTTTAGTDIKGAIGTQPGTGSGQTLTAAAGGGADGIKLTVSGGATGARGSVVLSPGFAAQLDGLVTSLLSQNGPVQSSTDGINRSIKSLSDQRDRMTARLTTIEANYRAQFTQLDTLVASMNTTSSFLTQQLATLQKTAA